MSMMKLNFNNAQFDYKPYPICYIPDFLDESTYRELSESYPDMDKFSFKTKLGGKYSLAERNNGEFYFEFLEKNPCWKSFYDQVKSEKFALGVIDFLKSH